MSAEPFALVTRYAQEVITEAELRALLQKPGRKAYIGFEPSGTAHLGWMICARKVRDLQDAGFHVSILLADWHAYINDKLSGDMEKIRSCGKYMEDVFLALGVKPEVKFLYASDYVGDARYWETVIRIGKASSLSRVKRAMSIMGRKEEDAELDYSKTMYPAMQAADIFFNKWDLAYGGMDQRHAHMLARDAAEKLGWTKPVALHTPLLPSLQAGEGRMDPAAGKMSKSRPESGIFLHDTAEQVEGKLQKAYCPAGVADGNPLLELFRLVILPVQGRVTIERDAKHGPPVEAVSYAELEAAFKAGLHPLDLKKAAAQYVNESLEPVRRYFEKHPKNLERMREVTGRA